MTGVLLRIDEAIRAPEAADLEEAREDARRSLDDVRRIARDLRPDTLEELGLRSALSALGHALQRQTGVAVERRLDATCPPLGEDAEIVVYRVAQEALTNVVRHAGAGRVVIALGRDDGAVTLTVDDDGRGVSAHVGDEARGHHRHARARAARPRPPDGRTLPARRHAGDPADPGAMTTPATTTVLVADDHAVVRHGVRSILNAQPDFEVAPRRATARRRSSKAVALRPRPRHPRRVDAAHDRPRGRGRARGAARPRSGC